MRGRVADERDPVDEELLPLLHPHRDVDDRRAVLRLLGFGRFKRVRRVGLVRFRIVAASSPENR